MKAEYMKTKYVKVGANTVESVKEDTQFVLDVAGFDEVSGDGANDQALSLSIIFEEPGVQVEILGAFRLVGSQKIGLQISAIHKVPHTQCFIHINGVLGGNSRSNFIGKIIIEKKAQQTNSYLEDNILVIGEGTNNTSQPILEIDADDVKASHGATTGRINEDQLFYLESRGLSEEEAQDIIIEGFFAGLLDRIQDETIRDKVKGTLNV